MSFTPLQDRVVVRRLESDEKTAEQTTGWSPDRSSCSENQWSTLLAAKSMAVIIEFIIVLAPKTPL